MVDDRNRNALASWQRRAEYLRANNLPVPPFQVPTTRQASTSSYGPSTTAYSGPPYRADLPGTGLVIVITLLFGLFGLIPAAIRASQAETLGHPGGAYWKAFWFTLLIPVVVWAVVIASIASSTP